MPPIVLVVDDEPLMRALIERSLYAVTSMVLSSASEDDALVYVRTRSVDIAIVDYGVASDARGFIKRLRECRTGIRILLISGYGNVTGHGEDAFLQKPWDVKQLRRVIDDLLQSRHSHD